MSPFETLAESAARMRSLVSKNETTPEAFRAALAEVPQREREAWLNLVLGTDDVPEDGMELPRGCTPYLPCSVDTLVRMVELAGVHSRDVFVDVGSGIGRAAAITHLLTGAAAIGVEIQSHLVRASRDLATRLNSSRLAVVHGDATSLTEYLAIGSVFFLYCPFGGARLEKVLDGLASIARTRPIRVCSVNAPLPPRDWLAPVSSSSDCVSVYRSTLLDVN